MIDWPVFLRQWSDEMLALLARLKGSGILGEVEEDALARKTLLAPPAGEERIESAEDRLGNRLPSSYRDFLCCSNGFLLPDMDGGFGRLLRVDEISNYETLYPDKYAEFASGELNCSDELYFQYGSSQDAYCYRTIYAESLLAVSTHHTPLVYLLNPGVVFDDGEWEAWAYNFHGGASRFRSFREMLVAERVRSLRSFSELVAAATGN